MEMTVDDDDGDGAMMMMEPVNKRPMHLYIFSECLDVSCAGTTAHFAPNVRPTKQMKFMKIRCTHKSLLVDNVSHWKFIHFVSIRFCATRERYK